MITQITQDSWQIDASFYMVRHEGHYGFGESLLAATIAAITLASRA